ncbi:neural cell adhesion molecule 1, partial [Biomphalaria glabrata]
TRTEDMTKDVFITKLSTYDGRNYLTKFTFTVIRTLDNKDINRVFTLTFQSKYFTRELQFVVRPRGPPQPVTNVTIRDVTHSSVKLLWLSGFNGGEQQEFIVKFRHFSESPKSSWTSAVAIGDGHKSEVWTETVMTDLGSGTDYEFQIVSSNRLGSVQSETYRFRTLERTILNVGVIAGIVISVVIFIFTLLAIVIIKRKSVCSSRSGETRDVHVLCHSTDQAETNDDQRYTDVAGTSRKLYVNAVAKGRDEKCRPTKATDVYDTCTQDTDTDEAHYQSLDVINTDNRTPDQRNTSAEICKTTV